MPTSKWLAPRQIPPPQGRTRRPQDRFIPADELNEFNNWNPPPLDVGRPPRKPTFTAAGDRQPDERLWPQAQVDALVQAARQSGYQDGYRDGLSALESFKISHAQQMSAQVGALLQSFNEQLDQLEQQMSHTLLQCSLDLARQVLRSELQQHPELVAQVAGEAVDALMRSARQVEVRVHPDDLELVRMGAGEFLDARGARLAADESVERGGCLVESDTALVDASIGQRWAQAQRALAGD